MCYASELLSVTDHEEEGTCLPVLVFLCVLYVGAVEVHALSMAAYVTSCVNALCVLCIWDTCSVLLLVEPENWLLLMYLQMGRQQM